MRWLNGPEAFAVLAVIKPRRETRTHFFGQALICGHDCSRLQIPAESDARLRGTPDCRAHLESSELIEWWGGSGVAAKGSWRAKGAFLGRCSIC